MVRDVFFAMPRIANAAEEGIKEKQSFEALLIKNAVENGLVASRAWLDKVMQLYNLSKNNHGN